MYKNTLCRLPCIFFGVANYWGQDFNIIFTPFGVFGSQFTFTIAATDIIACGLTLQCDFCLWTAHVAEVAVRPHGHHIEYSAKCASVTCRQLAWSTLVQYPHP